MSMLRINIILTVHINCGTDGDNEAGDAGVNLIFLFQTLEGYWKRASTVGK